MNQIVVTKDSGIVTLRLNRPEKLNAITPDMAHALHNAVDETNNDPSARAVIFTGTGERAFSAGSDISLLDTYPTPWDFRNRAEYNDIIRSIRVPVIAAVNGMALGGGLELALAADIIIAASHATFGAPEIKLGWVGGGGVVAGLVAAVGARNAALLLMTGDAVDADMARDWGLLSEVTAPEDLMDRARQIATAVAGNAPLATQVAKINIQAALNMPADQAMRYERDLQTINFATDDAAEGRAAFKAKRAAVFKGK